MVRRHSRKISKKAKEEVSILRDTAKALRKEASYYSRGAYGGVKGRLRKQAYDLERSAKRILRRKVTSRQRRR